MSICIKGCTNELAVNFNPFANVLDESCLFTGCTNSGAYNYNSQATIDDGSCYFAIAGCTDSTAFNYNPLANTNDNYMYISNSRMYKFFSPKLCIHLQMLMMVLVNHLYMVV